ncbi:MAG: hypothetical protein E7289_03750 [Lachnospiraceae bacterium]|nr:hypothetical protein [Lachnospiraceae bacterium]
MKKKIKKYLALTRCGIMEELQFRLGAAVRLFGNIIYLIIIYNLWRAIYESSPEPVVNGMTFSDTMIYLVLASALFTTMEMYITWDIGRSIKSGNIVFDFLRPMDYGTYSLWRCSGNTVVTVLVNLLPTMVIVYLITDGGFALSVNLGYFVLAMLMGIVLNFYINFFVGLICFYTESIWGVNIMKEVVVLLFSGASIPLAFFPESFQNIVYKLPFHAIYNTPLMMLIDNTLSTRARVEMLLVQLFWVFVVGLITSGFLRFSTRRLLVNGG